jgi:hypothetical protein
MIEQPDVPMVTHMLEAALAIEARRELARLRRVQLLVAEPPSSPDRRRGLLAEPLQRQIWRGGQRRDLV